MEKIKLNNDVLMPSIGFGVFQIPSAEAENAVSNALEVGYRLIDTASAYKNEEGVGAAIAKSNVSRDDLFITTKLWVQDYGYEAAKKAFNQSLNNLGLDYIDLYLMHQPYNDYYGSWGAMEELYQEGKVRAIGVSNFNSDRLVDFILNNKVIPAVNQIEIHPFYQQDEELNIMNEYKVQPEAWGPFAEGKNNIFTNPILSTIAEKYNKSIGQVILRWDIQRGVIAIPKSSKRSRIEENFSVWDFQLSEEDMELIRSIDTHQGLFSNMTGASRAESLNNVKIHD